mgnify:CR=1 FL=1
MISNEFSNNLVGQSSANAIQNLPNDGEYQMISINEWWYNISLRLLASVIVGPFTNATYKT